MVINHLLTGMVLQVATMISKNPLRIGLWDPFQMAAVLWRINGGAILSTGSSPGMDLQVVFHWTSLAFGQCLSG